MRKIFITSFLILLSVVMVSGSAYALSGVCSNCHTMHASQDGTLMGDGPRDNLLLYSCLGCHSGASGSPTTPNGAPIVLRTSGGAPAKTLAGGDFYWVDQGSDAAGHNVDLVAGPDAAIWPKLGNKPPGWDSTLTDGAGHKIADAGWNFQLTCAGQYGCHGDHNILGNDAGMKGAHHTNIGGTKTEAATPTTVGGSYRFCDRIKGLEDATWNWDETAANHNEYFGSTYNDGGALDKGTISFLCSECHGDYHTTADIGGTTTPWLRHPTDILLGRAAGTEYSGYNNQAPGSNTYNLQAPVARPAVPTTSRSTVAVGDSTTADGAIVMCLSCHRAHGSPYPDMLRWNYLDVQSGAGSSNTGCFVCHTTKDTL